MNFLFFSQSRFVVYPFQNHPTENEESRSISRRIRQLGSHIDGGDVSSKDSFQLRHQLAEAHLQHDPKAGRNHANIPQLGTTFGGG